MNPATVERDERTAAVENAAYRWSYLLLSFGILASVAYRSFALGQTSWDLLALVLIGGAVNAVYQGSHHVLYRRWALTSLLTLVIAGILGAAMVLIGR
jgi:hypothetical protein